MRGIKEEREERGRNGGVEEHGRDGSEGAQERWRNRGKKELNEKGREGRSKREREVGMSAGEKDRGMN